ncbi:uncharacterized protein LOC113337198 [Papaver somniferum]|uniref:uncharacterized protein LOC113337198 n=1 Tax=Papaver somniferum TaxID=3469 RepID=UPI000E6FBD68|nr:uncharacterized protein LOC113337198 [Papaver somniferum]
MELVQSPLVPNFPYKTIWNPHVPPKINLFFWTASLSKISTQDSLQRRNFKLASRCPLCLSHCEFTEHLLLSCQFACKVWSLILPSHSSWIPPLSILQLAQTWSSNTITGPAKLIWDLVPAAVLWEIWNERNTRIFQEKSQSYFQDLMFNHRPIIEYMDSDSETPVMVDFLKPH